MNLVDRIKNILLSPRTEWPKIAGEAATVQSLYVGYILVLAAIAPLALLIRSGGVAIAAAIAQYVIALVITYLMALIVDTLAPTFNGTKDFTQSLKLVAYSYTAPWVAGDLPAARRHDRRPDRAHRRDLRLVYVLSGRAGAEEMSAGKGRRLHDRRRALRHRAGDRARRRADVRACSAARWPVRDSEWCAERRRRERGACAPARSNLARRQALPVGLV